MIKTRYENYEIFTKDPSFIKEINEATNSDFLQTQCETDGNDLADHHDREFKVLEKYGWNLERFKAEYPVWWISFKDLSTSFFIHVLGLEEVMGHIFRNDWESAKKAFIDRVKEDGYSRVWMEIEDVLFNGPQIRECLKNKYQSAFELEIENAKVVIQRKYDDIISKELENLGTFDFYDNMQKEYTEMVNNAGLKATKKIRVIEWDKVKLLKEEFASKDEDKILNGFIEKIHLAPEYIGLKFNKYSDKEIYNRISEQVNKKTVDDYTKKIYKIAEVQNNFLAVRSLSTLKADELNDYGYDYSRCFNPIFEENDMKLSSIDWVAKLIKE